MRFTTIIYYCIPLIFYATTFYIGFLYTHYQIQNTIYIGLITAPAIVVAAILERTCPERLDYVHLDQPFSTDLGHFLIGFQLGYGIGIGACVYYLHTWLLQNNFTFFWPTGWPYILQVFFAFILGESLSYWQHRLSHSIPWLWRFHALHHSGARLNLIRAARFHFVDAVTGGFLAYLPIAVLGAPSDMIIWLTAFNGVCGVLTHANIKMRTPHWLSYFVCTPAVHRYHHSSDNIEGNRNFSTTIMLFDIVFGTFLAPSQPGPDQIGIKNDPVLRDRGFIVQLLSPFIGEKKIVGT